MTDGLYLEFESRSAGFLTFGDGTTTFVGNYRVSQWEQASGAWQDSGFLPVREVIHFDVFSATSLSDLNFRIRKIEAFCSDVERYNRFPLSELRTLMYYSGVGMASTTSTSNQARVIEAKFHPARGYPLTASGGFVSPGHRLEIVRTAYWTRDFETNSYVSDKVNNGLRVTTPAATSDVAEVQVDISDAAPSEEANGGLAYLVLGTTDGVYQYAAKAGATGDWLSTGDRINNAVNSNVLRYIPSITSESSSGEIVVYKPLAAGNWAIYFSARNNSTTTSFLVRFMFLSPGETYRFNSPFTAIPANATLPQYYFGGLIANRAELSSFRILATASDVGKTLDIDNVVVVNLQNNGRVLGVRGIATASILRKIVIQPNEAISAQPFIDEGFGVLGDARLFFKNLAARSVGYAGAYLKCTGTNWREVFDSSPTSNTWTITANQFSHIGQ